MLNSIRIAVIQPESPACLGLFKLFPVILSWVIKGYPTSHYCLETPGMKAYLCRGHLEIKSAVVPEHTLVIYQVFKFIIYDKRKVNAVISVQHILCHLAHLYMFEEHRCARLYGIKVCCSEPVERTLPEYLL